MSDIVADVPNILNTRAAVVLTGYGAAGPCNVAEAIISLLRSDEPIDRDVRELLADALARGHFGNRIDETNEDGLAIPRLEITGLGRDGRVGKAVLERHKWLDAAEALVELRASGTKGRGAIEAIGSEFGLGFEVVEKAIKLHNRFNKELDDPTSELIRSALNFWRDNKFSRNNTEHYYFARSLFVEREAEKAVK